MTPKKHYLQKMNLPHWSLTRYTLGQTPGPEVVGQYTANSVVILLTCFGRAIFFSYQSFACLFYLCFVVSCMFLKIDRQTDKMNKHKLNEFGGGEDLGGVGKKEKHDQNILYRKKFNRFVYAITQIETIICILKSEEERMLQCVGRFQERGNVGVHLRAE